MDKACDGSLGDFIAALGSDRPTPGSGSAAAVAIALAAACLSKAVAVTLKHGEDPTLQNLGEASAALTAAALAGLTEEAEAFRLQLRSDAPSAARRSASVAEGLQTCAAGVLDLAGRLEERIAPTVAGDLGAARALVGAATTIVAANRAEAGRR